MDRYKSKGQSDTAQSFSLFKQLLSRKLFPRNIGKLGYKRRVAG